MKHCWYLILPITVFLVSYADLSVTLYFDKTCSEFEEFNPVALYIWNNHGIVGLIIFKSSVTLASCVCMGVVLRRKNKPWRLTVSIFGVVVCIILIGWWFFWIFVEQACWLDV